MTFNISHLIVAITALAVGLALGLAAPKTPEPGRSANFPYDSTAQFVRIQTVTGEGYYTGTWWGECPLEECDKCEGDGFITDWKHVQGGYSKP